MTGHSATSRQVSVFRIVRTMRVTIAVVLTAAFAISGAAQDVTTGAGAPADAFP
jgi:hypothetical protein